MTLANRKLDPGVETVFLMADEEFSHVSSSLIKQITPLASDEELARFVPGVIIPDLRARLDERADETGRGGVG
jgi:pantetheine-phosphate adenylyltransferase